jgi:predicted glycoside hydrolase/deacetylase ChbG (UPF0249 family)
MTRGARRLAVCADDFGLTPAISDGIAALAQQGRLTAISCLTHGEHWPAGARRLAGLPDTVECGLHFNLTEGAPASAELRAQWPRLPALPRLIALAHLGRLPLPAIAAEFRTQWQRFVDATGAVPAFVDGHQHVHHLPGVRDLVLDALAAAGPAVAVRNTGRVSGPGFAFKRWAIARTGGAALLGQLQRRGLPHNAVLVGVRDFGDADYRRLMRGWLAALPPQGALLFCHPGAAGPGADGPDDIAAARRREAVYLGSPAFADDLAGAGVTLGPSWTERSRPG